MTATTRTSKPISRLEIGLALMVVLSIAIVAIPEERLRTSLEIAPDTYPAQLVGDGYTGGNSTARWIDERSRRWQCQLKEGAGDPYCSMQLDVTDAEGVGLDLSQFDRMTIWAEYSGDASHVRLYLRNRHPSYFDPSNGITTKYNGIEVPVHALATGLDLRMDNFTVAAWWLIGGNIPLELSHPEFNEVAIIEVQTGSTVRSGVHEIELKKISWSGPIVKPTTLYQSVIVIWSTIVLCILVLRLISIQRELKRQREAQQELLAVNASLNLENRHYEDLAKTDALTGLYNRVGIREILHQGLIDWRSRATPFSFVIMDLDSFKQINDSHGHDVGDKILADAAKLMRDHSRHSDVLARWGGEEFVLVCPNTTLEQAVQAAENLRVAIEKYLVYPQIQVTASFGVASMTEPSLDHLFKQADIALYQAKRLGRNRVYAGMSDDEVSARRKSAQA